jgi:hypothetical protein
MQAKFSVFGVCALTLLPIAFACGGDDSGDHITIPQPDASIDAMEPCLAQTMYSPTFGSDNTEVTDYPAGSGTDPSPHEIYFLGYLDNNDPGDYLYMDLYAGYGAFSSGDIVPGSYSLVDDDTAYSTCGACVYLGAKVDSTTGDVGNYYFAHSGTLTLTSTTGRLTGALQDAIFYRVPKDADGNPSDESNLDCNSMIKSVTFDSVITIDTGSGSGSAAPATSSARTLTRRWAN